MNRMRAFLVALGLLCPMTAEVVAAEAKPNIIFILADDYGLPGVRCYGGKFKTPNIDALASGGIRFEQCFAAPLCGPSRALLMTGRYAFRTGVTTNGNGAAATPEKDGCVALRMKQAGYATAVAGKWRQLSHFSTREDGARWGFDEFMIWGAAGPGAPKQGKGERYWDPSYNHNGEPLAGVDGKYGPDLLHEFVVDFVRRHKDQPFFVYYPTPLIHGPILRTPDSPAGAAGGKARKDSDGSLYADNIEYLDKLVGKLTAELDAMKLREKTLIVFTGDNGSVGQGTLKGRTVDGGKGSLLEGGSRVALIANWPGTAPAGRVLPDLVDFSDMLPTFTELAGVPATEGRPIDGRSFAPQLRGQPGNPRDWAYVHLGDKFYVRSQRFKLNQSGELFDMRDAPFQQIPVPETSTDPAAATARKELGQALEKLVAQHAGTPPTPKKAKKAAKAGT